MTHGSSHRTALLAGATGLVGGHLLRRLLADPRYRQVIAVSRKGLGIEHPKLRPLITDFDAIEAAIAGLGETVDDAFCALGTRSKPRAAETPSGASTSVTWSPSPGRHVRPARSA